MKAFISYTRKDKFYKTKFAKHLKPICEKYSLDIFDDSKIKPGEEWEKRIWKEFEKSEIIFLLISIEYINSDYCFKKEFKYAIERHEKRTACVIPIILDDCSWKSIDSLAKLQVLPSDNKTIKRGFRSQNQALSEVSNLIDHLFKSGVIFPRKPRKKTERIKPKIEDYVHSYFKAVFFDLDGTLVRGCKGYENFRYSWAMVWEILGFQDKVRKKYYRRYVNQQISYEEWVSKTRDIFREKGLTRSHFVDIAKKVRLTHNCRESLKILKDRGFIISLVSGSIDTFFHEVFPDHHNYFDYVFINKFFYDERGILKSFEVTDFDFEGKFSAIEKVCIENNLKLSECVFVGEGHNDRYASQNLSAAGGLSIGYPADLVFDYVDHEVRKDGLHAVLDVIFSKDMVVQKKLDFVDGN